MDKIIIANWKNNPETLEQARELYDFEIAEAAKYSNVKTAICPPENFFKDLASRNSDFLGAQDFFWQPGEAVSAKYVLIGHSDRRYGLGETDKIINKKLKAALSAGITPILLVGERNKGDDRKAEITRQLLADFAGLPTSQVGRVSYPQICYEPVWAISRPNPEIDLSKFTQSPKLSAFTNTTILNPDTPENTLEAVKIINNFLVTNYQLPITSCLYGGSVTKNNVADFLKHPEIGGAVIGGASLRKEEFAEILKIVSNL